jgi:acyl carrier protein
MTHLQLSAREFSQIIGETWAEILGLPAVGPDDDFFELGGNSLIVAAAVARLGERLGIELPMRALFEAPTPVEMAELIAELRDERAAGMTPFLPDWVIPLQREGTGRPIFVFPAGDNEMRALAIDAQIAAHVGRDHPFWGFRREDSHLSQAREDGVPTLAAEYIRQMRIIQGAGPFLLFGNCAGGYLAWEVARQLLAAGEEIAGVLFYEVPLRPDFDRLMPGFTPAHISREWHLSLYYRPEPLPVSLTHLMTDSWHARDSGAAWRKVSRGAYETVVIPVETIGATTFMAMRQEIIAGHVRDWIERSEHRLLAR